MSQVLHLHYEIPSSEVDFTRAGDASSAVKRTLKKLGFQSEVIRKVAIAMYEGEINVSIHGHGGVADVDITSDRVYIELTDQGPGIPDVEMAMKEGFTTAPDHARALGFGAGMGLPNIKKYTDEMEIETEIGKGTKLKMTVLA